MKLHYILAYLYFPIIKNGSKNNPYVSSSVAHDKQFYFFIVSTNEKTRLTPFLIEFSDKLALETPAAA